ncbi:uncharacterized protein LOC112504975 [Cynara cardunculus var. scolymus]|nr:uncharacterized protein LOC112504975 [Cynara cardunculus var. scolymus]
MKPRIVVWKHAATHASSSLYRHGLRAHISRLYQNQSLTSTYRFSKKRIQKHTQILHCDKMMNILALGLVLTSLVTGAVWSPPPPPDNREEVIVKGGHRVIVVEYEKEGDGNTKVLISPHDPSASGVDSTDTCHSADGNPPVDDAEAKFSRPRELVCDAFGKCKHKIANAFGRTKDKVSDTAQDIEEHAKEAASGAVGKAKDTVYGYEERMKGAANEAFGKGKQAAKDINEAKSKLAEKVSEKIEGIEDKAKGAAIGESLDNAKDSIAQGIGKAKKVAGDVMETVRDSATKAKSFDMVDSPKRIGEDIQRNVSGRVEEGAEHVMEQAKEAAANVQKVGQKSLGEIISKLKEVMYDVFWYMVSPEKVDAVVGLIHMLGFSTAYGMCMWVTFVSSYILGRYLPRQQFGMVQSRIYPVYFKAMAYCVGAALLGHLVSRRKESLSSIKEIFQGLSLLSALLMVLINMIWLEPRSTKVMFERMKIEKEEGRGIAGAVREGIADNGSDTVVRPPANVAAERQDVLRMNEKLKRLNSYSSALNVSTLVVLTWHMAYMGQRLQATR